MKALVISCLLFVFSLSLKANTDSNKYYVIGCQIFNTQFQIKKTFPGTYCVFLDDGSFVNYQQYNGVFSRVDKNGKILWSRKERLHHQLKLSFDGTKLITLLSEIKKGEVCNVRYDELALFDLKTGKKLSSWSNYNHRQKMLEDYKEMTLMFLPKEDRLTPDYNCEYTHFNSIGEIPDNPVAAKIPAFKKGNFIVNMNGFYRYAIFNPTLDKILWEIEIPHPHDAHDVQVLETGKILSYNNQGSRNKLNQPTISFTLLDPVTKNIDWSFPEKNQFGEYVAPNNGGIQFVGDNLLFSVTNINDGGAAYLTDRKGKVLSKYVYAPSDAFGHPFGFNSIKQFDLSSFLKNNRL